MKLADKLKANELYFLDRRACFAMAYSAGWSKVQKMLDPDLTNPITFVLLEEE